MPQFYYIYICAISKGIEICLPLYRDELISLPASFNKANRVRAIAEIKKRLSEFATRITSIGRARDHSSISFQLCCHIEMF